MGHWLIYVSVGLAPFALGFLIGGTFAWYRGLNEGFREGYMLRKRKPSISNDEPEKQLGMLGGTTCFPVRERTAKS